MNVCFRFIVFIFLIIVFNEFLFLDKIVRMVLFKAILG
ncbi:hypothetical protein LEP1GSC059_2687 [Leptospira noguchii serovar Panama str. CZ214]|uniref:Uncharacterized protein n=1 Tax=Leptospira noguchii serovar Panama str. CZ214 TaxID=1001595 RepID=T0FDJ0_9LEPT|nr:hypothetical protein LEP1GSC059_2687 [Leptospira noguchii serovar Panama str. CZ214]